MRYNASQPLLLPIDEIILTPLETQIIRAMRSWSKNRRWVRNVGGLANAHGLDVSLVYRYIVKLTRKGKIIPLYRPGRGPGGDRIVIFLPTGGQMDPKVKALMDALQMALQLIPDFEQIDESYPKEVWEIKKRIVETLEEVQ